MDRIISFRPISPEELLNRLGLFKNEKDTIYNNFFYVQLVNGFEYYETEHTLLARRKDRNFYRLYICSDSEDDLIYLLNNLDNCVYAVNIPTKKDIKPWEFLFSKTSFSFFAKYDRYKNTNIVERASSIGEYASIMDTDGIMELLDISLESDFNVYTDYLPTKDDIVEMINNRQVIIYKENGKVLGIHIFTIEGKKCYLNLWYDLSGNGLCLLFDVYNMMYKEGLKLAYFWVKSTNKKVIKIHKLTGAEPDGVSDYTFLNK